MVWKDTGIESRKVPGGPGVSENSGSQAGLRQRGEHKAFLSGWYNHTSTDAQEQQVPPSKEKHHMTYVKTWTSNTTSFHLTGAVDAEETKHRDGSLAISRR